MVPRHRRIAVIGAGPSGLAAVKALEAENIFEYIRVFERRETVGGLWAYEPEPDKFHLNSVEAESPSDIPKSLGLGRPCLTTSLPEKPGLRLSSYDTLDSNAGARTMAYTHTPLPMVNSVSSIRKFGQNNPTRPRHAVLQYIETLFEPYLHLLQLNTTVEKIEKLESESWLLTLRKHGVKHGSDASCRDYWWQEEFDAVVVASGHFSVASIPEIPGLEETALQFPEKFEHSKSWRSQRDYVGKRVLLIGGSVSAADLAEDLHDIVQGPLYVSLRREVEFLQDAFNLPNVIKKSLIKRITPDSDGTIEFEDGTTERGFDKVIFATGYKLSYPFLPFKAVTPSNRLAGFYQHIFWIGDPSLVIIGQVRAAISFRVYEYQAVAVSRFFAGRSRQLPNNETQKEWEKERLEYKGPTELFHEINPDFADYYGWLRDFAGPPAEGTAAYSLPVFEDDWVQSDIEVLVAKGAYWRELRKRHDERTSDRKL